MTNDVYRSTSRQRYSDVFVFKTSQLEQLSYFRIFCLLYLSVFFFIIRPSENLSMNGAGWEAIATGCATAKEEKRSHISDIDPLGISVIHSLISGLEVLARAVTLPDRSGLVFRLPWPDIEQAD